MEHDSALKGRGRCMCGGGQTSRRHCPEKDRWAGAGSSITDTGASHAGKMYICISQQTYGNFNTTRKLLEKGLEGDSPLN